MPFSSRIRIRPILMLAGLLCQATVFAHCMANQPVPGKGSRVTGTISFAPSVEPEGIRVTSSRLILVAAFVPAPLPTPAEFDTWPQARKAQWRAQWQKTEAGKNHRAAEEKRFSRLPKKETRLQTGNRFEFSGVKPGDYDLAGEFRIEYRKQEFRADFYARLKVLEVEEVKLDTIQLTLHRVLKRGEKIPSLKGLERSKTIALLESSNQAKLVVFWSPRNSIPTKIRGQLEKLHLEPGLAVVAIAIGSDQEKHREHKRQPPFAQHHAFAGKLDSPLPRLFGVRNLPSVWLVDQEGTIRFTNAEFSASGFDLQKGWKEIQSGMEGNEQN